jgi:beta-barrel assembly-enhancing protease
MPVVFTVLRDGRERQFTAMAKPACPSWFSVEPNAKTDAGADGERVRVTSGLMDFVADDHELAAVVAHELAHNLLGHPAMLAKVRKDKAKAIRETELLADRLSVWLMANAGYNPGTAINFWQRYGPRKSSGIFGSPTHPHWKKRIMVLQQEINSLHSVTATSAAKHPPLLQNNSNQQ